MLKIAPGLFQPKPLSYYESLTQGGKITVDLTAAQAAVVLKAHDRGVWYLDENEVNTLHTAIHRLKDQIWP